MTEKILILDFGSQYTQLIARRIREQHVYSEIVPFNKALESVKNQRPIGIILSGGPQSVYESESIKVEEAIFDLGLPVLGICYGLQAMSHHFGGEIKSANNREYGHAKIHNQGSELLKGLPDEIDVWMSHGDEVIKPPKGFEITARSDNSVAAVDNARNKLFGVQFHPEVAHTEFGSQILSNFLDICEAKRDWSMESYIEVETKRIKQVAGNNNVICALSGGVDSSVAAALVSKAIGNQQTCIFVDTGLLRLNEAKEVLESYKNLDLNVVHVDASKEFLKELKGINDPEKKRKIIGEKFIEVFEREAAKIDNASFLVQGTLYPDIIESVSVNGPSAVIKSHHNVGGLPEKMKLKLIEPLKELFKDEVRELGKELGLPEKIVRRQPFPGPGLAIRIIGDVTSERLAVLKKADAIVREEIYNWDQEHQVWQYFAVLLPVSSVGVMGDQRTYENTIAVRAVESVDGMTADWAKLPDELLQKISSRIISEVRGINRVVYDISSKPPATIEWE